MQKTRAKIPALLLIITVVAACALHFFQLYNQAENISNTEKDNTQFSYAIYLLIFLGFVLAAIYSALKKDLAKTFDLENGRSSIFLSSSAVALTFFYDFIHQGYNCYSYIASVSFIEYAYVIPLGFTALFALVSCFYFITIASTAKNLSYDFRNFTLLHFAPVLWAFTKLFGIMMQIVDIRVNIDICCEFILLCVLLCFLFSMISAIDKKDAGTTRIFVFSSAMLSAISFIVGVPRIAMLVMGKGSEINQVTFSSVTYIMLGIFSFTLLCDVNKRSKQKI